MNNDEELSGGPDGVDRLALDQARLLYLPTGQNSDCFVDDYAGLEGSVPWHGDLDCNGVVDCRDVHWLDHFPGSRRCCMSDCLSVRICRADFDRNGEINIQDMSDFLSHFGLWETDPGYDPLYDFDYGDCAGVAACAGRGATDAVNSVDIQDFSTFLSTYGYTCGCFGASLTGGGESASMAGDSAGGTGEDPDFVEWVRQASPQEVLDWWAQYSGGSSGR